MAFSTISFISLLLWTSGNLPSAASAELRGASEDSSVLTYGNNSKHNCAVACAKFQEIPYVQVTSTSGNITQYDVEKSDFWSTFQAEVSPSCFVNPTCPEEVAQVLEILKDNQCQFAVKSGGHAAFAGASNIDGGVTILLKELNTLQLDREAGVVQIGTGNLWIDVYEYLTPKKMSVVGGRVTGIGVGGLVLGGGISFFSGRYGWACDGVRNYEVVVASGEILQVNQASYPDLYWSLRGGGNNFGIVTRMDLEVFEQGDLWGGAMALPWTVKDDVINALYDFGQRQSSHNEDEVDVDASIWAAFGYTQQPQPGKFISIEPVYAKPVVNPPVLENFTKLEPVLMNTIKIRNLTDISKELNQSNPNGLRETCWSHNFILTKEVMSKCLDIFEEELESVKDVEGIVPVMLFQPFTTAVIKHFARNGGNALGITDEDGPLLLMSIPIMWSDSSRDEEVLAFARTIMDRCVEASRKLGAFHSYIYQNYAAKEQRVFESYGKTSLERLRGVSRKYDPDGVFQRLQPVYHKLW
ncbi:FAD-dependent monooxygenase CTB5 [Pseudocercospora fuligena]|uniref:FAD-dependent monooxygenase CTB5 n=1 Tax=Pseudocercospora fuligena TaxID=685502 RepID=A0A8H6RVH5_9PEZI|nr:FAD-dependent monooxygenase CTB5 [Pseudocercospora fuligena]